MSARSWLGKPAGRRAETSQPATQPYSSCAKQQQQQLPNLQARESAAAAAAAAELIHSLSLCLSSEHANSVYFLQLSTEGFLFLFFFSRLYTPHTLLLSAATAAYSFSQCLPVWVNTLQIFFFAKQNGGLPKKENGRKAVIRARQERKEKLERSRGRKVICSSTDSLKVSWKRALEKIAVMVGRINGHLSALKLKGCNGCSRTLE